MEWMRNRRKELGLSQRQVAALAEITMSRLSEFESGLRLPSPEIAAKLGGALGVDGVAGSGQILPREAMRRLTRPKPYEFPAVNKEPWQRMERRLDWKLKQIKLPKEVAAWIQRHLACNSGQEGLSLYQLGAAGARPVIANAHECGYRGLAILDDKGEALGERMQPALHWLTPEFECVLWPQVTFLNGLRVDLLILLRVGGGKSRWIVVEVDGPHHDAETDAKRDKWVTVPVFRVSNKDVMRLAYGAEVRKIFLSLRMEPSRVVGRNRNVC